MTKYLISYFVTLSAFLAIDFVWLAWIARGIYVTEMGEMLRKDPVYLAAAVFYLMYAGGLTFFAVVPGLKAGSLLIAVAQGAAIGLIAYGTYNLTNLTVLNGFSLKLALIDMAWGTAASAAAVGAAFFIVRSNFEI
jgi:uncharacterized membrane protein